jgi:hypothetical protein
MTSYIVLNMIEGLLEPYTFASLDEALSFCLENYKLLYKEKFFDNQTIISDRILAWQNGYGSEANRLRVNDNLCEMAQKSFEKYKYFYAWVCTSKFNIEPLRDSYNIILQQHMTTKITI